MHFLLTNDDGIDAEGLAALRQAFAEFGDCTVVAPHEPHSGCSHRVSDNGAIRLERRAERCFALHGTPADCARIGLSQFAPDCAWVLSGINAGGNLGNDVFMSGTVAAVREAALCGRPGIAFSHYRRTREMDWDWNRCAVWARRVFARLSGIPMRPGEFWNVNFPHLSPEVAEPEIVFCPVDVAHFELTYEAVGDGFVYRGNYHARSRTSGHDVDVCFRGEISVSRMTVSSNAPVG
jgi:5'-nucleotidase